MSKNDFYVSLKKDLEVKISNNSFDDKDSPEHRSSHRKPRTSHPVHPNSHVRKNARLKGMKSMDGEEFLNQLMQSRSERELSHNQSNRRQVSSSISNYR